MLQQNGTLSVWKFQPTPLYHGGGISLHVTLSVNWSDIIQICEKKKKIKRYSLFNYVKSLLFGKHRLFIHLVCLL